MSFKWPNKDPDETLDYSMDWSRFLGYDHSTSSGTVIVSNLWFIDDASGVKIDTSEQLKLRFDEFKADPQYQAGYSDAMAYAEEDKRAISLLAKRVLELEKVIDKIKTLVK